MNFLRRRRPVPPLPIEDAEVDPELALHHGRAQRAVDRANAAVQRSEALQRATELYDTRLRGNRG